MTFTRNPDANAPLGTVTDYDGQERKPLRDFDLLVLPEMTLTGAGVTQLEARIVDYRNAVARYRLRELDFDAFGIDLDDARDDLADIPGVSPEAEPGDLQLVDWAEVRRRPETAYGNHRELRKLCALLMADETPEAAS